MYITNTTQHLSVTASPRLKMDQTTAQVSFLRVRKRSGHAHDTVTHTAAHKQNTHTWSLTSMKHIKVTSTSIHDAVGTRCERRRYGVMKTIRTCSPNIKAVMKLRRSVPDINSHVREQRIGLPTVLGNFALKMEKYLPSCVPENLCRDLQYWNQGGVPQRHFFVCSFEDFNIRAPSSNMVSCCFFGSSFFQISMIVLLCNI